MHGKWIVRRELHPEQARLAGRGHFQSAHNLHPIMADKKIEKALYGPSLTEVALGAILGLAAGVLAACVYLVFKPVLTVKEMPKEPVRGATYYIPGSDSGAKGRTWSAKQKQFLAGTSVSLIEEELNAWVVSALAAPAAKAGAKPEDGKPALNGIFNPGTPNFKIVDGKLHIGFKCVLNWYGLTKEVQVMSSGEMVKSGDKFVYAPETLHLGSCPVHLLPAVAGPLASNLMGKKKVPEAIAAAWAKVSDATLEGNTLKLTVQ
jgi:hypothetical protein